MTESPQPEGTVWGLLSEVIPSQGGSQPLRLSILSIVSFLDRCLGGLSPTFNSAARCMARPCMQPASAVHTMGLLAQPAKQEMMYTCMGAVSNPSSPRCRGQIWRATGAAQSPSQGPYAGLRLGPEPGLGASYLFLVFTA